MGKKCLQKMTREEERPLREKGKRIEEYLEKLERANTLEEARRYLEKVSEAQQARRQFDEYYFELREVYETSFLHSLSSRSKQKIYPILYAFIRIKNLVFGKLSYEVICDKREPTLRPKIFAVTHIGKFDVEIASLALKEHYYLLSGDFENIHDTLEGGVLKINGVIFIKEDDWKDRALAKEKMKSVLQNGGNLMYFPEGSWNLSPNLPVLPIFRGIVDVALASNAIITPVGIEQYGSHFKVNIGDNFDARQVLRDTCGMDWTQYEQLERDMQKQIADGIKDELRDILATLKYEIFETERLTEEEHTGRAFEREIAKKISEWTNTIEEFESHIYRPKGQVNAKEVFAPLEQIGKRT